MSDSLPLSNKETDYLIAGTADAEASNISGGGGWSKKVASCAAVFSFVVAGSMLTSFHSSQSSSSNETPIELANKRVLKHSIVANKVGYDSLSSHTLNAYQQQLVVEPDVEMIMSVPECNDMTCGDLVWEIEPQDGPRVGTVTYDKTVKSSSVSVLFTEANTQFTVNVKDLVTGDLLVSTVGTVKYVRREIRTLSDKDRTKFFNALKTVFTVSTDEGKALYGDKYLGHAHLTALHNYDDVKYHGNLFFLTSHPVMQIKCERSMLAVDKTVALAYWDFAMDSHLGRDWASSPIYQEDWFGPVATSKESNYRVTGTFHDVKLIYDPDKTMFPNSYHGLAGFLSSTYSTLQTEHLQRSNQYCGFASVQGQTECTNIQMCFDGFEESSNLREFDTCMEHFVHANLHTMHGGQWDCAVSWSDFYEEHKEWLDEMLLSIMGVHASGYSNEFVDEGLISCPDSCDLSGDCSCKSAIEGIEKVEHVDDLTDIELYKYLAKVYAALAIGDLKGMEYIRRQETYKIGDITLKDVYIPLDLKGEGKIGGPLDNAKLRTLNALYLKTILFPGTFGIMVSGASANDPIFWVMHQLFDKALHALRLSPRFNKNGFTWNNKAKDMKWEGVTPFTRLDFEPYLADHVLHQNPLKNKELWAMLAPNAETVNYIYDQMTTWGGCEYDPFN